MGTCNDHGMAPAAHQSVDPIDWLVGPIDWVRRYMDDKAHTQPGRPSHPPIPSQNPTGRAAITPMQHPLQPLPPARRRRRPRLFAAAITASSLALCAGVAALASTTAVAFTMPAAWGNRNSGSCLSIVGQRPPPPPLALAVAPAVAGRWVATRLWMAPITNTRANFVGEVRCFDW